MTREEIIEGVKGCVGMYYGFRCGECSYGPYSSDCVESLHRDVERLLKAQEPHVVTLADYENNPNVDKDGNLAVWRESRHFNGIAYHEDGWIVLNRERVEGWFNSEVIRFWTSRPTPEQRWQT